LSAGFLLAYQKSKSNMSSKLSLLSGIQQVGIGCSDAEASWTWYRKMFGMDVPVFKDASTAALMTRYTGQEARQRYAILALNMQGGGGFEIWQFTDRPPQKPQFKIKPGDLGIFGVMMKCQNVARAREFFLHRGLQPSELLPDPVYGERFFLEDPDGNRFTFTRGLTWFGSGSHTNGGVQGVQIGVSNMESAMKFYAEVLGFGRIAADHTSRLTEFNGMNCRRVLLQPTNKPGGAFSNLLGMAEVELVQLIDEQAKKIYEGRYWGDQGFIHICFDVNDMEALKQNCEAKGHPFTVDSANSFDMGEAAGHFSYTEDPDGTLIEFVQTHRLPILKKLNWYLDLRKRNPAKPLPNWMLSAMRLQRVKD
jgi:catechol 2,3-dioxygenase-like lactoylglutathione lyase family enzyme